MARPGVLENDNEDLANRLGWTRDWRHCGGESRYTLSRLVGRGSYGHVAAAVRRADDREVAVKRITGAFDSRRDALCILSGSPASLKKAAPTPSDAPP
jgi:serine/threonine protein kinase